MLAAGSAPPFEALARQGASFPPSTRTEGFAVSGEKVMGEANFTDWADVDPTGAAALAAAPSSSIAAMGNPLPLSADANAILAELLRIWPENNEGFVRGLVRLLLGREADAEGLAYGLALLRRGSRLQAVQIVAECDEARMRRLDLSWLQELERLRPDGPWVHIWGALRRVAKFMLHLPSRLGRFAVKRMRNWLVNPRRQPIMELTAHNRQTGASLKYPEELATHLASFAPDQQRRQQQARWLEARDLRAYERKVFSQNGEDGIIQEILYRIGPGSEFFVEFGVESGVECNCARLVYEEDWSGLFMEAGDAKFQQLSERYRAYSKVHCAKSIVTSQNIEALLAENGVPSDLDLLSIDIDGNDYWVWKAINRWRPRLVVMEYNSSVPPSKKWVMRENPNHRWGGTSYFGASLASLASLGREKGYTLVGTNSLGVNAFFVRDDLVTPEKFLDPCVHYHYSAPVIGAFLGGHPPGSGPALEI
jgi:hypothetical protein